MGRRVAPLLALVVPCRHHPSVVEGHRTHRDIAVGSGPCGLLEGQAHGLLVAQPGAARSVRGRGGGFPPGGRR